jgi:hypothetical protein
MFVNLDTSFPGLGNGEESGDLSELADSIDDFLDLSGKLSRRSETDGLVSTS